MHTWRIYMHIGILRMPAHMYRIVHVCRHTCILRTCVVLYIQIWRIYPDLSTILYMNVCRLWRIFYMNVWIYVSHCVYICVCAHTMTLYIILWCCDACIRCYDASHTIMYISYCAYSYTVWCYDAYIPCYDACSFLHLHMQNMRYSCAYVHTIWYINAMYLNMLETNPPGGVPIYQVPSSRTRRKRTPLKEFVRGASRGVLALRVLDEGT